MGGPATAIRGLGGPRLGDLTFAFAAPAHQEVEKTEELGEQSNEVGEGQKSRVG